MPGRGERDESPRDAVPDADAALVANLAFELGACWRLGDDGSVETEWMSGDWARLGIAPGRCESDRLLERVAELDRAEVGAAIERLGEGRRVEITFRVSLETGDQVWLWARAQELPPGDRGRRFALVANDVTAERRSKEELDASAAQLRSLIERIPAMTYIEQWAPEGMDAPEAMTFCSPQVKDVLGVTPEERIEGGEDLLYGLIHPDDRDRVWAQSEEAVEGDFFSTDYRVIRADTGEVQWIHDDEQLMRDESGNPVYWLGIATDVTDRKKAEEALREQAGRLERENQLVKSQQMALLGTLTAGIAHEIRNPLNFVVNFAVANEDLTADLVGILATAGIESEGELEEVLADLRQNATTIAKHGNRALEIMMGMLSLSRTETPPAAPTDIGELVDRYAHLAYHGLRGRGLEIPNPVRIQLDPSLDDPVPAVEPDIGRVILNLVSNACEAISVEGYNGAGAAVTVATDRAEPWAKIRIHDTGPGIPTDVGERVFEPFFTTKPAGEGTGLGLAISRDIVMQHHGEIELRSEPGDTEFSVRLPLDDPA